MSLAILTDHQRRICTLATAVDREELAPGSGTVTANATTAQEIISISTTTGHWAEVIITQIDRNNITTARIPNSRGHMTDDLRCRGGLLSFGRGGGVGWAGLATVDPHDCRDHRSWGCPRRPPLIGSPVPAARVRRLDSGTWTYKHCAGRSEKELAMGAQQPGTSSPWLAM